EADGARPAGAGAVSAREPAAAADLRVTSGPEAVTPGLDAMSSAPDATTRPADAAQPSVGSRAASAAAAATVVEEPPTDEARGPGPRLPGRARPKTGGQRRYVQAIADHPITFGIGPAGTGKTYLAVAMAVEALGAGRVKRIILTRPAVEAGERLGFLPGDLQ